MTTMTTSSAVRRQKQDRLSVIAVGIVTLAALLLGVMLKSSVENRSQHFESKGISAAVPSSWIIEKGAGSLILVSWDPFVPDIRYSVSLESNDNNQPLMDVAARRSIILGNVLEAYRVLDETPIIRRGREGYKVTYAFIDTGAPDLPVVLQGVDYYFQADDKAMIITLQAQERDYEEALLRFESFLDSVSYTPGG